MHQAHTGTHRQNPPSRKSMARKRILEILTSCDLEGGWRQCTLLASRLPVHEFDIQFCLLSKDTSDLLLLEKTGLPVHAIGSGRKINPWILVPLIQLMRRWKPDVVHSWDDDANIYGPLAARISGVKTVFCSVCDVTLQKNEWGGVVDRLLKKCITKIIIPNRLLCDFDKTLPDKNDTQLSIIPPAISTHTKTTIKKNEFLQKLQLPENSRLVAISDKMKSGNQLRDAIWATELLKVAGNNVQVFICGKGPKRRSLEQFRNRVQLEDRIHFLDDPERIDQLMEHLDIYWRISGYSEKSSVPLIEAMQRGIPVIADASATHQGLIEHEKNGVLVSAGDPADLASWTQHLLENPAQAKQMGLMGKKITEGQYNSETTIQAIKKLYQEALAGHALSCTNTPNI